MIYADKPQQHLYIWNNKEEVKEFIELCRFRPYELEYFCAKFKPDPSRENVLVEYINGEQVIGSEDFFPENVDYIAVHDPNQFFDSFEDEPAYSGPEGVKATEVELDEDFWVESKFPYIGFLWFEDTFDRFGNAEFAISDIQPLNEVRTVTGLRELLCSPVAVKKVELLNQYRQMRSELK